MKILLISDTHGDNDIVDVLVKKHPNMDIYLHAGDCCSDPYSLFPFHVVRGNCDYFYDMDEIYTLKTPYGKLLMKHVPNMSLAALKKENVKIYIHGHTHQRKFSCIDDIYYICPGSTSRERDQFNNGYAILTITEKEVKVEFIDLE